MLRGSFWTGAESTHNRFLSRAGLAGLRRQSDVTEHPAPRVRGLETVVTGSEGPRPRSRSHLHAWAHWGHPELFRPLGGMSLPQGGPEPSGCLTSAGEAAGPREVLLPAPCPSPSPTHSQHSAPWSQGCCGPAWVPPQHTPSLGSLGSELMGLLLFPLSLAPSMPCEARCGRGTMVRDWIWGLE